MHDIYITIRYDILQSWSMNWLVAPQSMSVGPDLTSAVSVIWISTLMTRDLAAAITYCFGRCFSHWWRQSRWGVGVDFDFSVTLTGDSAWREGGGGFSFFTSRQANWLCTGSKGTHFTCCVSQNPTFLPLPEHHTLLLHHHSPLGVLHWHLPVQGTLDGAPVSLPWSSIGCQRLRGIHGHSDLATDSRSMWQLGCLFHACDQCPLEWGHFSEVGGRGIAQGWEEWGLEAFSISEKILLWTWAEVEWSIQSCTSHSGSSPQRLHLPPSSRTPCMWLCTILQGHWNWEPHPQAVQPGSEVLDQVCIRTWWW